MADVKISALPAASALTGTELVPIVQGGVTVQSTPAAFVSNGTLAVSGTNLSYTGTLTGGTGVVNIGSGQLVKDASGNVGIGTSTPTNTLSVSGSANVTGNVTLGDATTDTVQVNGYMGVGGASPNAGRAISISAAALTGDDQRAVSAGLTASSASTTSATAVVAVASTAASAFTVADLVGVRVYNGSKGAGSTITNYHGVRVDDLNQGTNNYGVTSLVSSGTNKWNIYASGTAQNYFAGNVGIGTSSPGAKLDIKQSGTNWYDGVRIVRSTNDNQRLALGNTSGASYIASIDATGGTNNALLFGRSTDGTTFTESARFDSSGNLGIGTSSPGALLHLNANNAAIRLSEAGTYYGSIQVDSAGGLTIASDPSNVAANSRLIFGVDGTERMRIDSAGNLITTVNAAAPSLSTNSTMSFELTSNTSLKVVVRGTDGVTRSVSLTLS